MEIKSKTAQMKTEGRIYIQHWALSIGMLISAVTYADPALRPPQINDHLQWFIEESASLFLEPMETAQNQFINAIKHRFSCKNTTTNENTCVITPEHQEPGGIGMITVEKRSFSEPVGQGQFVDISVYFHATQISIDDIRNSTLKGWRPNLTSPPKACPDAFTYPGMEWGKPSLHIAFHGSRIDCAKLISNGITFHIRIYSRSQQ